jgi:hypothetical protein
MLDIDSVVNQMQSFVGNAKTPTLIHKIARDTYQRFEEAKKELIDSFV